MEKTPLKFKDVGTGSNSPTVAPESKKVKDYPRFSVDATDFPGLDKLQVGKPDVCAFKVVKTGERIKDWPVEDRGKLEITLEIRAVAEMPSKGKFDSKTKLAEAGY